MIQGNIGASSLFEALYAAIITVIGHAPADSTPVRFAPALGLYRDAFRAMAELRLANDANIAEASAIYGRIEPAVGQMRTEAAAELVSTHATVAELVMRMGQAQYTGSAALLLAMLTLGAGIGWNVDRSVARIAVAMRRLAEGDAEVPVDGAARRDALGEMARAFAIFRDNARENTRLQSAQLEMARRAEKAKRASLIAMVETIEAEAGRLLRTCLH